MSLLLSLTPVVRGEVEAGESQRLTEQLAKWAHSKYQREPASNVIEGKNRHTYMCAHVLCIYK